MALKTMTALVLGLWCCCCCCSRSAWSRRTAWAQPSNATAITTTAAAAMRRRIRGTTGARPAWRNNDGATVPALLSDTDIDDAKTHEDPHRRHRSLVEAHNFFAPLACAEPQCSVQSTWTAANYQPLAGTVVIPCGHCVVMDYRSNGTAAAPSNRSTLVLPHGLDIQGRLVIPGNAYRYLRLTIVTPFVRVQGQLTMDATRSLVGAESNVLILLTDDSGSGGPPASAPTAFVPAGNNQYACSAAASGPPELCEVGSKAIVVAGGRLDIRGLPADCAAWVRLNAVVRNDRQSDIIVRQSGVSGCWGRGAEILLTSHTTDFESAQPFRLLADPAPYAEGLVRLALDGFVVPPVTEHDGDGLFAVEVALLSRNFVFEGARDPSDSLLGGHLIVLNTPAVPQLIDGVEIRNFGRQGNSICRLLLFISFCSCSLALCVCVFG